LQAGFAPLLAAQAEASADITTNEFAEEPSTFERPIVERLIARPFRDAAFAIAVKAAYRETCAITGLEIINGGGRAEVQAAHIRPVAERGPDSLRNGIALCGTMHWMFDRGLISISDDLSVLIARERVPDTIRRLINLSGRVCASERVDLRPHPNFLAYHRQEIFKG